MMRLRIAEKEFELGIKQSNLLFASIAVQIAVMWNGMLRSALIINFLKIKLVERPSIKCLPALLNFILQMKRFSRLFY